MMRLTHVYKRSSNSFHQSEIFLSWFFSFEQNLKFFCPQQNPVKFFQQFSLKKNEENSNSTNIQNALVIEYLLLVFVTLGGIYFNGKRLHTPCVIIIVLIKYCRIDRIRLGYEKCMEAISKLVIRKYLIFILCVHFSFEQIFIIS